MKISRKLFLMTTTLVAVVTVIAVTAGLYATKIEVQLERSRQAHALARSIAEISLLSESYQAHKTVRIEAQWQSRAESIIKDLGSARVFLPKIDSLQLLFDALIEAFDALRAIEGERRTLSPEPASENLERLLVLENRVATRMRAHSQNLLSQVFTIADDAQQTATKLQRQSARIVAILASVLSTGAILFSVFLTRNLSRRLQQLTGNVEAIRQGQVGERVELFGRDELTLFSQELNRMFQAREDQHLQLQQSEEQFRTLIESAPEEIFIQSEGHIVYMNQAGLNLLGATSAEQIVGRKVLEIVHPDYRDRVKQRIQALNSGEVNNVSPIEQRHLRLDGTPVDVEVVASRTTYKGKPAVQVFVRDISEKLVLQKASERASRLAAIGTLAAGVAHEINNPNSVIMHNIPAIKAVWDDLKALLDDHYTNDGDFILGGLGYTEIRNEMPQLLQDCADCSQRIKRIVNDLKDFSKDPDPTINETELTEMIDLNELADTASRLVENRIKTSTDHFSLELSTGQLFTKGSFLRLEQVVINLLINACQALTSPAQEIRLAIRHDPEQQMNWIEVCDQGQGISEQHQKQILEPFFTTRRETGGTGLGLSISNTIIQEHGGHIEISSTVGKGTCVRIALPAATKEQIT